MISASQDGTFPFCPLRLLARRASLRWPGSDERPALSLMDFHAPMSVAEIVQPHREPTPPAVIPRCFGKGQGLTHLALIAQATGSVMTSTPPWFILLVA